MANITIIIIMVRTERTIIEPNCSVNFYQWHSFNQEISLLAVNQLNRKKITKICELGTFGLLYCAIVA